jgi:tetratricopeptide (TPR) repeat protein
MENEGPESAVHLRFITKKTVIGFCAVVIPTCILAYLLISAITDIRFLELRNNLRSINEKSEDLRALTIISRFRQLSGDRISIYSSPEDLKREKEMMMLTTASDASSEENNLKTRIGLLVVNWINFFMGWAPVSLNRSNLAEKITDIAYYQERRRNFKSAIAAYKKSIPFIQETETLAYTKMHIAYSQVMLSDYKNALGTLSEIHKANDNLRITQTVHELEQILSNLKKRADLAETLVDPVQKAEYMFRIGAYQAALDILGNRQDLNDERVEFLKARALEETGNSDKALHLYRVAIQKNPQSQMALQANRRMYALGAFYGQGKEVRDESKRNSETVVNDTVLRDEIKKNEVFIEKIEARGRDDRVEKEVRRFEKEQVSKTITGVPSEGTVKNENKLPAAAEIPKVQEAHPGVIKRLPAAPPQVPPVKSTAEPIKKVNLRNPTQFKEASTLSRVEKKKVLTESYSQLDRILTEDGNEFFGVIYSETKDTLFIFTLAGNLKISTEQIAERGKVPSKSISQ